MLIIGHSKICPCICLCTLLLLNGCGNSNSIKPKEIIIFHAGSLSVPLKEISQEYEKRNPGTKIFLESAGSLVCARKVTELKKPCDIIASSDYFVINELLIPDYTSWSIRFATNEIVIAFQEKSKYSTEINPDNWVDILLRDDVIYSRSDPDSDPCGYRTIFTLMLAEKYWDKSGLASKILAKNKEYIRPKEVDLIALLESYAIDYMFQYKSVAIQHGLKYIELPKEINLSDPSKIEIYKSVSTDVAGNSPGTKMRVTGDYINYSLTVLDKAPQKEEAVNFVEFLISPEGMNIFKMNGQEPIIPFSTEQLEKLPAKLLKHLQKSEKN
ncbi:MAG: tungstate ABC transporter substrate-binding protein WtpA [Bacteroidetes bacterium]|nr:MAG: tungstate ABC transporter substrate-binding protein WtpA [Bacteroidota bacterium]